MSLVPNINQIYEKIQSFDIKNINTELEAKIGKYNDKGNFISDVKEKPFMLFLKTLKEIEKGLINNQLAAFLKQKGFGVIPHKHELSNVYYYENNFRKIVYDDDTVLWQRKTTILNQENKNYGIRVSLNQETTIDHDKYRVPDNFQTSRNRERRSFSLDNAVVDLTIVEQNINSKIVNKYEIELEFTGETKMIADFPKILAVIYRLYLNSNLLYSIPLVENLKFSLENYFDDKLSKVLVQARNIKKKDIVYGGIVGNPDSDYYVTYKADGVRKLLIIHESGIWLAFPPYEFNLVIKFEDRNFEKFFGTVIDGELISNDKYKYRFFAFDLLIKNERSIMMRNFKDRIKYLDEIVKSFPINETLSIEKKLTERMSYKTPSEFFIHMETMLNNRKNLDYKEDGLMFIPGGIYNPKSDHKKFKDRILTKNPDICKYKDVKDITIDFYIMKIPDGKIALYSSSKGNHVEFKGNSANVVTHEMINFNHPMTKDLISGTIVEYEYDRENKIFNPRRIRFDKPFANSLAVAQDNWKDLNDPITNEDLSGKTLSFAFSYQNRIKKSLFDFAGGSNNNEFIKILDLGTGRGGDLLKMVSNKGRILAVEPNNENRTELYNRIKNLKLEDSVIVLPFGAEDTDQIVEKINKNFDGEADVISMMLSLSFFWQSSTLLDKLVETISQSLRIGGKFLFLTIDGDTLENAVSSTNGILKFKDAEYEVFEEENSGFGRKVHVSLPGTIVEEQDEWLVKLDDLALRLEKHGILLKEVHRASHEKLLPKEALIYTSLYSYGYFEKEEEREGKIYYDKTGTDDSRKGKNKKVEAHASEYFWAAAKEEAKTASPATAAATATTTTSAPASTSAPAPASTSGSAPPAAKGATTAAAKAASEKPAAVSKAEAPASGTASGTVSKAPASTASPGKSASGAEVTAAVTAPATTSAPASTASPATGVTSAPATTSASTSAPEKPATSATGTASPAKSAAVSKAEAPASGTASGTASGQRSSPASTAKPATVSKAATTVSKPASTPLRHQGRNSIQALPTMKKSTSLQKLLIDFSAQENIGFITY